MRRSSVITVAACDPSIKQDIAGHDRSYVNGFALNLIQLPAGVKSYVGTVASMDHR